MIAACFARRSKSLNSLLVAMQVGGLKEVSILRDAFTGKSRGCGFAIFQDKDFAESAIEKMNKQYTLPGGTAPMEVRHFP